MEILTKVFETEFCSTKWDSLSQGQFTRGQSPTNPPMHCVCGSNFVNNAAAGNIASLKTFALPKIETVVGKAWEIKLSFIYCIALLGFFLEVQTFAAKFYYQKV